jgi:hypothetical protein
MQLHHWKIEMKRNIRWSRSNDDVVEFSFDQLEAARLEWEDEEEFKLDGEMYDMVDKEMQNGILIVRCIPDKREQQLLENYQKDVARNTKDSKWSVIKLTITPFAPSFFDKLLHPEKSFSKQQVVFTSTIVSQSLSILTPPPKGDFCSLVYHV